MHHLQQYNMKGNRAVNGSVAGAVDEPATQRPSLPPVSHVSTVSETSLIVAHNLPDGGRQTEPHQCRSHINGDVFYVSGRTNTTHSTAAHELDDQTVTTFQYFTYDRDYFRERQKSSCLQDSNLRHSMQWTSLYSNYRLLLTTVNDACYLLTVETRFETVTTTQQPSAAVCIHSGIFLRSRILLICLCIYPAVKYDNNNINWWNIVPTVV